MTYKAGTSTYLMDQVLQFLLLVLTDQVVLCRLLILMGQMVHLVQMVLGVQFHLEGQLYLLVLMDQPLLFLLEVHEALVPLDCQQDLRVQMGR